MASELTPKQFNNYDNIRLSDTDIKDFDASFLGQVLQKLSHWYTRRKACSNLRNWPFQKALLFFHGFLPLLKWPHVYVQAEQQAHWENHRFPHDTQSHIITTDSDCKFGTPLVLTTEHICTKCLLWTAGCFRRSSKGIWKSFTHRSSTQNTGFVCSRRNEKSSKRDMVAEGILAEMLNLVECSHPQNSFF